LSSNGHLLIPTLAKPCASSRKAWIFFACASTFRYFPGALGRFKTSI
jgi:hypothetical protein